MPCYDVSWHGRLLIRQASLGIELEGGERLGSDFTIVGVARSQGDNTYSVYPGKSSSARDHYREVVVSMEQAERRRRLDIVFRAYDDGMAFRYRFPEQPGLTTLAITEERSTFDFAGGPRAYTLPLGSFTTSYERRYAVSLLRDVPLDGLLGLPLLLEYPEGVWVALTEANLTDYAGMYLTRAAGAPGSLTSRLSPGPDSGMCGRDPMRPETLGRCHKERVRGRSQAMSCSGPFLAEVYADDLDTPEDPSSVTFRRLEVSSIKAHLAPAGGHVIRLTPSR